MGRPRKGFTKMLVANLGLTYQEKFEKEKGFCFPSEQKMEEKDLQKRTRFFAVLLEQLTRATTLLWNRKGLDLKFATLVWEFSRLLIRDHLPQIPGSFT